MQFNAKPPLIDLPESEWRLWCIENWPYNNSLQFSIPVGTFTNDSPDTNSVAWSKVIVEYNSVQYTITDDNTSDKYLYWELATPTVFAHAATIPAITEDLIMVGINTSGAFKSSWKAGQAAVVANTVDADALNGMTITGATIQTEATADRGIKLTSTTLKGYDAAGNETFSLTASDGSLVLTGSITTAAGSTIGTSYLDGIIALANLNVASQGWVQTCVFSSTDADTVSWGAGTFTAANGTAYSIDAGNTGNMSAKTYIYLNIAVSTTAYQTTTTATTAVGAGKVLVAIAQNGTGEATFTVMNGQGAKKIAASEIVANSITADQIAAGSIDVDQLNADCITADKIQVGAIEYDHMSAGAVSADRGDPSTYDYTSFTQDGKWQELDLSAIVPAGYRFVLLRGLLAAASAGNSFQMRRHGNTYAQNAAVHVAAVATTYLHANFFVACDADRKVEYMAQAGHFSSISLYVAAYWP